MNGISYFRHMNILLETEPISWCERPLVPFVKLLYFDTTNVEFL